MVSVAILKDALVVVLQKICNKLQCRCTFCTTYRCRLFCHTIPPSPTVAVGWSGSVKPHSHTWCSHAELRNNLLFLQSCGTTCAEVAFGLIGPLVATTNYLSSLLRLVGITPW